MIPALYQPSFPAYRIRLVTHSKNSPERLSQQYPDAEVIQASLDSLRDCSLILNGVTTITYVSPISTNKKSSSAGTNRHYKFAQFIFSSVIHPQVRKLVNHDRKRLTEEYLVESGLWYTILQPSHFVDNAMGRLPLIEGAPEAQTCSRGHL